MSKELIENLRSVGRLWEDEAADLIDRLTTENQNLLLANRDCVDHFNVMKDDLAAAQKRIEELKDKLFDAKAKASEDRIELSCKLAAAQAQLKVMRDALENVEGALDESGMYQHYPVTYDLVIEALAQPSDYSALREMLKAERERCAKRCEEIDVDAFGSDRPAPNDCANAIRAMEDKR